MESNRAKPAEDQRQHASKSTDGVAVISAVRLCPERIADRQPPLDELTVLQIFGVERVELRLERGIRLPMTTHVMGRGMPRLTTPPRYTLQSATADGGPPCSGERSYSH